MRYYDLTLTDQTGKVLEKWTSYPNGQADPHALNISFDMAISPGDLVAGQSSIVIEGISLDNLSNAQKYGITIKDGAVTTGANLVLKGGMKAGLPLASPDESGLLVKGSVYQSWGTWVGTDMSLSFLVVPAIYTQENPGGFVFQWKVGQKISDAITKTLSTVYGALPIVIQLGTDVIAIREDQGFYATFQQFAQHVQKVTKGRVSPTYGGVRMAFNQGTIYVFDGTSTTPKQVALRFEDFVGQPTWVLPNTIQVKTILRGDIQVGSVLKFPQGFQSAPGFVQNTPTSYPGINKYQSAIQGTFLVNQIRHIGNFRDPDGGAWATLFNCIPWNG